MFETKAIKKRLKDRIRPKQTHPKAINNLNKTRSTKYGLALEQIVSKSLQSGSFTEEYDFYRLHKVAGWRERSDKNKNIKQRKKLREPLDLGE